MNQDKRYIRLSLHRIVAGVVSFILVAALLVTGTFAWRDNTQHTTGEGGADSVKLYDVRLLEEFTEPTNWSVVDEPVTHDIRVSNVGSVVRGFSAAYVRLSLKEYMEISTVIYRETEERYMIDNHDGRYVAFPTEAEARAAYPENDTVQLTDYITGDSGWFIQTKEKDPNGQYGKFVVTDITYSEPRALVPGTMRASNEAKVSVNHQAGTHGECDYTPTVWSEHIHASETAESPFRQYTEWQMDGDNFISLSSFLASGSRPVAKWIYNDRNPDDPYIYWGKQLAPEEQTLPVMNSMRLVRQPEGRFYYAVHADMEAVSPDELYKWEDCPIKEAYEKNTPKLTILPKQECLEVGDEQQISDVFDVIIEPNDGTVGISRWISYDEAIISVGIEDSKLYAKSAGKALLKVVLTNGETAVYELQVEEALHQAFSFKINTSLAGGNAVALNIGSHPDNNFSIDWGDGSAIEEIKDNAGMGTLTKHIYAETNTYVISIKGRDGVLAGGISFKDEKRLTEVLTPLLQQNDTSLDGIFRNCTALRNFPEDIFKNNPQTESLANTFQCCSALTVNIPEGMFRYTPNVISFSGTFMDCVGLIGSIPSDLFACNGEVLYFVNTFAGCSILSGNIPETLFHNNTKVLSFANTFSGCRRLSGAIPEKLFANNQANVSFGSTFYGCTSLSGLVPENLFANNIAAESFANTFHDCAGLSGTIPENLFAKNTKAAAFNNVFYGCSGLSGEIPEGTVPEQYRGE